MDELEEKKRILLKNKCHILKMPNNKAKVEMVRAYLSLLGYCEFISGYEYVDSCVDIDDEFIEKYNRYVFRDTKKNIDKLDDNALKLYEKLKEIIDSYKENDFCEYAHIGFTKVNKRVMSEALWDFFATLGSDVSKIYYEMVLGDNIFLNSTVMDRLGYSMDASVIDNTCITVQNIPNYLDFYITLAHEVGHCYQFNLQKNQRNCAMFDPYCEITSILFEKLFIEYLKNNHIIKDTSILELDDHITFLNNLSSSKMICKLLMDKKIGIINPYDLSYTCNIKKDDIKKAISDDCGYIKPFNEKLELVEIHYSFGNIISRYFMEKLKNDFDNEWINFKNFICTVEYLPVSEVIDNYFDIELIKDEVKKLTKSYRER